MYRYSGKGGRAVSSRQSLNRAGGVVAREAEDIREGNVFATDNLDDLLKTKSKDDQCQLGDGCVSHLAEHPAYNRTHRTELAAPCATNRAAGMIRPKN